MFETLKNLLSVLGGNDKHPSRYDENDYRLVAAALLVHAATIDGDMTDTEKDKLRTVVKARFNLTETATDELVAEAIAAENNAIDMYHFTSQLNRVLDGKARARVVEMMWQIVFADGGVTEFEDNLVWRAADLLGVSRDERIALRQRVGAGQ